MTENNTNTETVQIEDSGGNAEAAKYRRQLREVEAERDTLAERLTTLQRAEVERLAAEQIAVGSSLWLTGTELADLLNDDGTVNPDAVQTAAKAAIDDHGLGISKTAPVAPIVPDAGTTPSKDNYRKSFEAAFGID